MSDLYIEDNRIIIAITSSLINPDANDRKNACFGVFFAEDSKYNIGGKISNIYGPNEADRDAVLKGLQHYDEIRALNKYTNIVKLLTNSDYVFRNRKELASKFSKLAIDIQRISLYDNPRIQGADKLIEKILKSN